MEEYYNNSAVSQSRLKCLLIHPKAYNNSESELYFEEKKHFIIGTAVDMCLTQRHLKFNDYYHVSNLINKPSDTIKSIISMVFDNAKEHFTEELRMISDIDYYEIILDACNSHNYQSRWNDQTRVNKVIENYEYWEDLKAGFGKQVLSQEEKTLIDTIVMSIRTNEYTSSYFNSDLDTLYQLPIYFKYKDIDCKALLDMVIINHKIKIIQPIDIKTMGDYTSNFHKSLRRNRYDIQASFYTEALKSMYPGYTILPFKFIVESTIDPGTPLVYTCTQDLLNIGKHGKKVVEYGVGTGKAILCQEVRGFDDLIQLYKYYESHGYEVEKKVSQSKGELQIDWFGTI